MKNALKICSTTTAALLAVASIATPATAEGIRAGTLIENTASASYDDGGGTQTIDSNTVVVKVDELLDVTVASLNSGPVAASPGPAVLTFELTNTGNGPEAFSLTANPAVAGNDFDTALDGIAVDSNGNGVYDSGVDQILTGPETTALLDPDQTLTVFVLATVPRGVADGNQSDVDLLVQAVTGTGTPGTTIVGQGVDGSDAVAGLSGADANAIGSLLVGITSVDLIKSASIADPFGGTSAIPGAIVTYIITANVSGAGSVADLVVTDSFPAGTTYQSSSLRLDSVPLSDQAGDDAGQASASAISVSLGTVSGGTNRIITFKVEID